MSHLDEGTIRKILNLQGSPLIQKAISERQLEVIRKGFNHLSQEGNSALYIADEVGLGKTYIALGIASLLRHFSANPENHQDVILVPKENLQQKWRKEILQFSRNNYLLNDNRVKSVIGKPTGEIQIHEQLEAISADVPAYHLYRNTSFSFGLSMSGKKNVMEELRNYFQDDFSLDCLLRAKDAGYFTEKSKPRLKKLCAYLMAIVNPSIELLIVDEGHNFKSGPGTDDDADVAARNAVAARFFGLKINSDEDKVIFNDFPELRGKIKPRVQKLLVLSATPKTYSLLELKRQLDCFLPRHVLSDCKKESEIKERLPYFLIRGKMEYVIRNNRYTRNQCRYEHRNGNVEKAADALPITLQEGEQALFMGLLQYNTIKHLNLSHNGHMEMGMLAGFETYRLDAHKSVKDAPEYEDIRSNKISTSQDHRILEQMLESWEEEFRDPPPHPKQSVIVDALLDMMKRGEKALVFVRRVASAIEMEGRLMSRWEKEVIAPELKDKWLTQLPSRELTSLLEAYEEYEENKQLREHIDEILDGLVHRLLQPRFGYDFRYLKESIRKEHALKIGLYHIYHHLKTLDSDGTFRQGLIRQLRLSTYKTEHIDKAYQLLEKEYANWSKLLDVDTVSESGEAEDDAYFFHAYFQTPAGGSFKRKRVYQVDWFDLNFYLINRHFRIADFKESALKKRNIHAKDSGELKEVQEIFIKHTSEGRFVERDLDEDEYPGMLFKDTLITRLFTDLLEEEVRAFIEDHQQHGHERLFHELKILSIIIRSILRNGSGFLPVFIAAHADGQETDNLLKILKDGDSIFRLVTREFKTIVRDYRLLRAVNYPESETIKSIESKLLYQSPIKGLSGMKKNKSKWASQFRMPGFPYALITTDIFREGEDLHTYCQNIYHYGIAWNCTDMEQRTGRIDRINSLSHRQMTSHQDVNFDNRIHVFYPYIQRTLEVNQVHRLFTSINEFVKAFDIVDSIREDGLAATADKVEAMPAVIEKSLQSQFEHHHFKGDIEAGGVIELQSRIGYSQEQVMEILHRMTRLLFDSAEYYYPPNLDCSEFIIRADMILKQDENRRGPFHLKVNNDRYPGRFMLEVSAYLFKKSSAVMAAIKSEKLQGNYSVIEVDDYYALSYSIEIDKVGDDFFGSIYQLLRYADRIERESTNFDLSVFE